jgi:hypothetical protein
MAAKTKLETQAEWVAHGMIAGMRAQLDRESDPDKRKSLENAIAEQRKRIVPD